MSIDHCRSCTHSIIAWHIASQALDSSVNWAVKSLVQLLPLLHGDGLTVHFLRQRVEHSKKNEGDNALRS